MTHFCFAYYRFRVYFANYKFWFRFVSQITVSSPYESTRNKQQLDDDIKAAEAWLYADAKRELWNIREVFLPSIKTQEASLICFIAAAFLHKSNSSAFFFLFHLHPTEYPSPTNRSFSPPHHLFFIPMRETSHLAFFFGYQIRSLNRENSEMAFSLRWTQ